MSEAIGTVGRMSTDHAIAQLAESQLGLCTWHQLRSLGLSPRQLQRRVESGRLVRLAPAVYRLNGVPVSWRQHALAAVLGGPPETVASHFTAAALHGLGSHPELPHVIVGPGRSARGPLRAVHHAALTPADRAVVGVVPTTSAARTLVDCARVSGAQRVVRLVDDAFHAGLATVAEVERALLRSDGRARAGGRSLRSALDPWRAPILPESAAEARLFRQLEEWGFPPPQLQIPVFCDGHVVARIDLGWPERLLGIEYDSERFHGPDRWMADEARHRVLVTLGWTLIHADKADLRPGERSLRDELRRCWRVTEPSVA